MINKIQELLNKSHSAFHTVQIVKEVLKNAGFAEIFEQNAFELEAGKSYFVSRNGTSLIAFKLPKKMNNVFHICASHSDSPTFKLKPNPLYNVQNLSMLKVEPYGGMIMNTWLDRPLSIAGRVTFKNESSVYTQLIDINKDLCVIPNLAIHMNREINDGYKYNANIDMNAILGNAIKEQSFVEFLNKETNNNDQILGFDLYLYNRDEARLTGWNQEFLSSPRLDDLSSAYATLYGFINSKDIKNPAVYALFDNEEVGSLTRQGANSTFLKDTLTRICNEFALSFEQSISKSFMLSVDNAHANHPNHLEKTDKTVDVELNKGIVVKYNANQHYTSDAFSSALVKKISNDIGLNIQEFTNRSDLRGGSTLGNISNSEVSLLGVDIGIPQLAMHSSNEFLGVNDVEDMIKFSKKYFEVSLDITEEKIIID